MVARELPATYVAAKAAEVTFDAQREALAARCVEYKRGGNTLLQISRILNEEGIKTKTGRVWSAANVAQLMNNPRAPLSKVSKRQQAREKKAARKKGNWKTFDQELAWIAQRHPHLEEWRQLAREWLGEREQAVSQNLQGIDALVRYLIMNDLPAAPEEFLLSRTVAPDFYECIFGEETTHSNVLVNNCAHYFLEWVLARPQFCEEDEDGRMQRSPAFRNPIPHRSRKGLPRHDESVRSTLPYGFIEELRLMIAEGPNFGDWKWAQSAMGIALSNMKLRKKRRKEDDEQDDMRISPVWYQVDPATIDHDDPDCVWRKRTRVLPSELGKTGGQGKEIETVYEMWSPVRWVALLIKLQLPLRLFQVRMLDSGEADTWRWQDGEWALNTNLLAQGSEREPYANGVFLKPNRLIDGDAKVILHINTNKTADIGKWGLTKGYNVPWIVGGPVHQDPFYWLEKLRRWQEKYNPLGRLTKWSELDGRHIPPKAKAQLAAYPDTAFLFRMAENPDASHLPLAMQRVDRPWYLCLEKLEQRLAARGETLPGGKPIRLVVVKQKTRAQVTTLFSLHSLRVSLLTALALDGQVPLAILQKIAGHSRLVMTLYYTKPGAKQAREAIQAGVRRLNEHSDETIMDWLANAEYTELVRDVIANNPESFRVAVAEEKHLRSPAGWMSMLDGLCLVGGNNIEFEAPGCHNGGPNIGNVTAPRYAPVVGGARNCPMCRWFITRPYFLPQLATRWNNANYHCYDAREQVVIAEQRFRDIEDRRAAALAADQIFAEQKQYKEAQRALENAAKKFDELTQTVAAITRLMERCRKALTEEEGGTSLVAVGGLIEFEYSIDEVNSELLQVSGVSEGALLYHDLDPGKAVLRQGQILDAALVRDDLPPLFMKLTEEEQKLAGSAMLRHLAQSMNPQNPELGRYQVVSLVDARKSLRARLGGAVEEALQIASSEGASRRVKVPQLEAA